MTHQIHPDEIIDKYPYLIGSSSTENKKLFIITTLTKNECFVRFKVIRGDFELLTSNREEALREYNKSVV